jgi:hypothetical protein
MKSLLPVLCAALAVASFQDPKRDDPRSGPLDPVAAFAGKFEGKGKGPMGTYQETLTGEWSVDGKVLLVRSQSKIASQTVFEDLRVFVQDAATGKLRMHQFTAGTWTVYDVTASGRTLAFRETAREGLQTEPWRYTYEVQKNGDLSYQLHTGEEGPTLFVSGALRRAE